MLQNEASKGNDYRFEITLINLICPVVSLTESLTPLMSGLCDKSPARYHFLSYDIKTFSVPAHTTVLSIPRVYNTKIPSRMILAFYKQEMISGCKTECNYLTSTDINLRYLRVCHNGLVIREFKPTVGNNQHTEDFLAFAQFARGSKTRFPIDIDDYKSGYTYFSMDLLENCESPLCSAEVILSGYMSLEIEMNEPTKDQHILMCYGSSPSSLDIDMNHHCRFSRGVV